MSKVKFEKLESAVVTMNNSVDSYRQFDISANVSVTSKNTVHNVTSGLVRLKGAEQNSKAATFNSWGADVSYSIPTEFDHCEVVTAIKAFIEDCTTKVAEGSLLNVVSL